MSNSNNDNYDEKIDNSNNNENNIINNKHEEDVIPLMSELTDTTTIQEQPQQEQEEEQESKPGAIYIVIIIIILNLLNNADRFIPSATKDLVKSEFQLNDSETGFFVFAFLIVFMTCNPLFGSLVDNRVSRKLIIFVGVIIWSISASSAYFANGFVTFLLSRAGVGMGEAAFIACTIPLISDYYPPSRRNRVLAIIFASAPVGAALGFILGGKLSQSLGWRYAYLITGLPGILMAFLVLLIKDPGFGNFEKKSLSPSSPSPSSSPSTPSSGCSFCPGSSNTDAISWCDLIKQLLRNREYLFATIGITLATFGNGAMADWLPTFFSRTVKDVTLSSASVSIGIISLLGGIGGTATGGLLADLLNDKIKNSYFFMCFIGLFVAAFTLIITFFTHIGFYPKMAVLAVSEISMLFYIAPCLTITTNCVQANVRSRAIGIQTFILHVLGDAISPVLVGVISDTSKSFTCETACATTRAVILIPSALIASSLAFFLGWRFAKQPVPSQKFLG